MSSTAINNNIFEVLDTQKYMMSSIKKVEKIPKFILKLWNIVNDPELTCIIEWGENGLSFVIKQPYNMYKKVLPLYFKHSNLNSFIRQLNMYGFKKNTDNEKSSISNCNSVDIFEFSHKYFVRGRYDLLNIIKRKTPVSKATHETPINLKNDYVNVENGRLVNEVKIMKAKQIATENFAKQLTLQYETFSKQIETFNARFRMQQNVIKKLCRVINAFGNQQSKSKIIKPSQLFAINKDNIRTLRNNNQVNHYFSNTDSNYVDLDFLNKTINSSDINY